MAVTSASFIAIFTEFDNDVAYPAATIDYYIGLSAKLLSECRWGDLYDDGRYLFVAHNLVLERQAQMSAATGGVPGLSSGIVSSKAVDKVSVSYDTAAAMEPNAGHWGLTTYGQRYLRLSRMIGAGGLQL